MNLNECPRCGQSQPPQSSYCKGCGLPFNEASLSKLEELEHNEVTPSNVSYFSAFAYPLKGSGLSLLIAGSILFSLISILPMQMIIQFFVGGYIGSFMFKIIRETVRGNLEPVDWPEFNNFFDDIVTPFLQILFVSLFCALPMFLYFYFNLGTQNASPQTQFIMVYSCVALGLIYFPMALLSVAMNESILGVYPPVVFGLMRTVFKDYLIVLGVLILSFALNFILNGIFLKVPLLGGLMLSALGLYSMMVNMHAIGLIAYNNRQAVGLRPLKKP